METGDYSTTLKSAARLCLLLWLGAWTENLPAQPPDCTEEAAGRALDRVGCASGQQLERVLSYRNPGRYEHVMREAVAAASEISGCLNETAPIPEGTPRKEFHCLQYRLLEFYAEVSQAETETGALHFQDLLARSSLRIHFCMIDEDLPIADCLAWMQEALRDYQSVFRAAVEFHTDRQTALEGGVAEGLGFSIEKPGPDFAEFKQVLELAVENAVRFPLVLGKPLGSALRSLLCDAYRLYPEQRAWLDHHYNLLVQFDAGNMAASGQLYLFVKELEELFRPAPGMPGFLSVSSPDRGTAPPPCSEADSVFVVPELRLRPGFRLADPQKLERALNQLGTVLVQSERFAEQSMHRWKPLISYGSLLFRLAQSLRIPASRSREMGELRHRLMAASRDAILLRAISPERHPPNLAMIQAAAGDQIATYGEELLSEMEIELLIPFAEDYLKAGRDLLAGPQKQQLHRLLAIAYALRGDEAKVRANLQQSNLAPEEFETIRDQLRKSGAAVFLQH